MAETGVDLERHVSFTDLCKYIEIPDETDSHEHFCIRNHQNYWYCFALPMR